MTQDSTYAIEVQVQSRFVPAESRPHANHFVFAYTVTLRNAGSMSARLVTRRWMITESDGNVREVRGDGVIGEQPWMRPGDDFEYTSGAVLKTPVGTLGGSYQMLADDGTRFEARIPTVTLSIPRTLH